MLLIAFLLGLSGSAHCLLMCGPVVSVFLNANDWRRLVLYHIGRLMTYMWLGLIFGLIGHTWIVGPYQQLISIIVGLTLVLMVLFRMKLRLLERINRFTTGVISSIYRNKLLPQNPYLKSLSLGALNGLMPCGLLYAAILGAAMMPSIGYSFAFMFLFWVGTSPFLVIVSIIKKRFNRQLSGLKVIGQTVMVVLGLALILRGAALDIPFLSPVLDFVMPQDMMIGYTSDLNTCH